MIFPILNDHFGYKFLDKDGSGAFHPGVDMNGAGVGNADLNTEIRAVADGVVTYVQDWSLLGRGFGKHLYIKHSIDGQDVWSHYCHLNQIMVKVGVAVKEGSIIGLMGSTGFSTSAHLHFELRKKPLGVNFYPVLSHTLEFMNESYYDPIAFITAHITEQQSKEEIIKQIIKLLQKL